MSRRRTLVLQRPGDEPGSLMSLGSMREVRELFAGFNTATDGTEPSSGIVVLHGPGFVAEIATFSDQINQVMIHVKEQDIAFAVLWRLCQKAGWKMLDPDTGQLFG